MKTDLPPDLAFHWTSLQCRVTGFTHRNGSPPTFPNGERASELPLPELPLPALPLPEPPLPEPTDGRRRPEAVLPLREDLRRRPRTKSPLKHLEARDAGPWEKSDGQLAEDVLEQGQAGGDGRREGDKGGDERQAVNPDNGGVTPNHRRDLTGILFALLASRRALYHMTSPQESKHRTVKKRRRRRGGAPVQRTSRWKVGGEVGGPCSRTSQNTLRSVRVGVPSVR